MTVTTADHGAARLITWDRQARRNAWDLETMTAIADAIEAAGGDPDVRCVVLRGAGEHFSAGDDLQAAIEADSSRLGGDHRGLPAPHPGGPRRAGAGHRGRRRRVRGRCARVRRQLRPAPVHRPGAAAHARGRDRAGGEQRRHAAAAGGARRERRARAAARRRGSATPPGHASTGSPPRWCLGRTLDARIEHWSEVFSRSSRAAVAATKAMLNERFGELLRRGDGPRDTPLRAPVRRGRRPGGAARVRGAARALVLPSGYPHPEA